MIIPDLLSSARSRVPFFTGNSDGFIAQLVLATLGIGASNWTAKALGSKGEWTDEKDAIHTLRVLAIGKNCMRIIKI